MMKKIVRILTVFEKTTLAFVAIFLFVILNILIKNLFLRIDFSSNKAYTLSQSTERMIRELRKKVVITTYISSDIPVRLIPVRTGVFDLLEEYERLSNGSIKIKHVDPKKNPEEAQKNGLSPLQFSEIKKDAYNVTSSYFGIVISSNGKKEVIPQVVQAPNLEYDITSAIYRLTEEKKHIIVVFGMSKQYEQRDIYSVFRSLIEKNMRVIYANNDGEALKKDLKKARAVVIIASQNLSFNPSQKEILFSYLINGGKIIVMASGVDVTNDLTTTTPVHNLFDFLEKAGVILKHELVLSESAGIATFTTQEGGFLIRTPLKYHFWVKTSRFDKKNTDFKNISTLIFPWTSALTKISTASSSFSALVFSESQSWETKSSVVTPDTIERPSSEKRFSSFVLLAKLKVKKGELIVIPSSRFVEDTFAAQGVDNIDLIFNFIEKYIFKGRLSGIRSRAVEVLPLPQLSDREKDFIKYATTFAAPILFLLWGGFLLRKRKQRHVV